MKRANWMLPKSRIHARIKYFKAILARINNLSTNCCQDTEKNPPITTIKMPLNESRFGDFIFFNYYF